MKFTLSLSKKVFLFVSIPLLLQLFFLAALGYLEFKAEEALRLANQSEKISNAIKKLTEDFFQIISINEKSLPVFFGTEESALVLTDSLEADRRKLDQIGGSDPEIKRVVTFAKQSSYEAFELLAELRSAQVRSPVQGRDMRRPLWGKLRRVSRSIINELLSVGENQIKLANQAPEIQSVYRTRAQAVMLSAGVFDILLGLVLVTFLTRGITSRLHRLSENTIRLSKGIPLHPMMTGVDEIAKLDQFFHRMAQDLENSSRIERAVVEKARDVICKIDGAYRFISANQAAQNLFDLNQNDLLGESVLDLVLSSETHRLVEYLNDLKINPSSPPIEIRMQGSFGHPLDTIWSAHWSSEDQSFFCVIHDITDRRKAEMLKQEVMAMITHDLRSPISTITNILFFFETGVLGKLDEEGMKYIRMAKSNSDRMVVLVNDLLDLEKFKSGMMVLAIDEFKLIASFESCGQLSAAFADEVGVSLVWDKTEIIAKADQTKVDRVLSNLVNNAIKYSKKGQTINISAKEDGGYAVVGVHDQGEGIPSEMLEIVFDRFQQASGQSSKQGGSGLGLAICKAIVEAHGGKIWAESPGPNGQGSSFVFTLPIA